MLRQELDFIDALRAVDHCKAKVEVIDSGARVRLTRKGVSVTAESLPRAVMLLFALDQGEVG